MAATLARLYSAELEGIESRLIEVEVDLNVGLHSFNIVGLADKSLTEARERINSALKHAGAKPPNRENRKITINLAPADVRKTGSHYDLALALGYLRATGQLASFDEAHSLFVGELALDGRLRPVRGALSIAEAARAHGIRDVYLPEDNAPEAAAVTDVRVWGLSSLSHAIALLEKRVTPAPHVYAPVERAAQKVPDLAEVSGHESAKRALMIAAAGGHNLLFIGPPGVGKSLLAQALAGILPPLSRPEAIEVTKIWSAAGQPVRGLIEERPFRAPHHSASAVAIVGGGSDPRPGEISLAHRGILFLDEFPEFAKNVVESLRQPLEAGVVHVARAKTTLRLPAQFTLVAAMNPCPCGYAGDPEKECKCTPYEVIRYQKKISGPLLDRIDMQIRIPRIRVAELREKKTGGLTSAEAASHVRAARERQAARFAALPEPRPVVNSDLSGPRAEHYAALTPDAESFLASLESARLSPRSYFRLLKTARTIADLDGDEAVAAPHLAEAFSYRLREEI